MPTPRTPRFRALALTALLAVAGAACGSDGGEDEAAAETTGPAAQEAAAVDDTPEPFTLRVGYIGTRGWGGPEGYADSQGVLLEQLAPLGVTAIESFAFPNGPHLSNALAGGSLDVGIYGDTPAINFRAAGNETRLIAQSRVDLSATIFTPSGGAASLEDLAGGTIGVAQGSFMHRFVLGLLEAEDLDGTVEITNLPLTDTVAALQSGSVDAAVIPWSSVPVYEAQGFTAILETFPEYAELAGSSVTVATQSFLDDHPDFAERWNAARGEVLELIRTDPEPYYDAQQPILDVDRSLVPAIEEDLEHYPVEPFTEDGLALLEGTKQFLVDIGAAQSDFDIADWQYPTGGA